ncbi:hypothetical protein [Peribacillus frigoritolerans]
MVLPSLKKYLSEVGSASAVIRPLLKGELNGNQDVYTNQDSKWD